MASAADESLQNIKSEFKNLESDMIKVGERLNNISNLFNNHYQVQKLNPEYFNPEDTEFYQNFSKFSSKWSETYMNQVVLIKENLEETFALFSREYSSINENIEDYFNAKKAFLNQRHDLNNKKEKLYKLQNIEKWDLSNDDIINTEAFIHNKDECIKRMLRTETQQLKYSEHKHLFFNNQIMKEYNKLKKYLNINLKSLNTKMVDENKTIIGDIFYLMKLINMNIL